MVDVRVRTAEGSDGVLQEAAVEELRSNLAGELLTAEHEAYESARNVWNGNIDRRPALIARCTGVADVIDAVNFARANDLLVAVRGGAHSAAGHGTCDGGLLIDLRSMRSVRVDPAARTAHAQGGATWGEFDRETQAFGLATTGGVVSNTGIGGLTLGGGLGWLMGKHGFTVDNLLSADVVTADGRFLRASANENEDLFWGLRGGGGNFGIVTSFEFQLHPVGPMVLGGMVVHPLAKAKEVLNFYREYSSSIPDEAESYAALTISPDGDPIVVILLGYNGPLQQGERVLDPARTFGPPIADLVQPMPYVVRQTLMDEDMGTHGVQRYWKSGVTTVLSDELIDAAIEGAGTLPSPLSAMALYRVHGAPTREACDKTAFSLRNQLWDVNVVSQWLDPADSDRQTRWTREVWSRLEPLTTGGVYVNHIAGDDGAERVRAAYGPNYDRLVALKNKYDPTNLFRVNANIKPTL